MQNNMLSLYDPFERVATLQEETLGLVRISDEIVSIKRLVECHEILEMILLINKKFNIPAGSILETDVDALESLRMNAGQVYLYGDPSREFTEPWKRKIKTLCRFYKIAVKNHKVI